MEVKNQGAAFFFVWGVGKSPLFEIELYNSISSLILKSIAQSPPRGLRKCIITLLLLYIIIINVSMRWTIQYT